MIIPIAQLVFPHHKVHVSRDDEDSSIHLFKHDHEVCDFTIVYDMDEAADWLIAPLPVLFYRVIGCE